MFWTIIFFALFFSICYIFYWFYRASSGTSIDNSIVHNFHSHNPSSSSPPPPLVLIFGWAGAKRRHLSRLLSYYENELHWSTISYISPILYYIRSTRYNETPQWEQIILLIEKYYHHYSGQSFSFYIHIHSNNGIFAYAALLDTLYSSSSTTITSLQKQIIKKSYKGLLIDSAPYRPLSFSSPLHTAIRSSPPMLMSIYGKFIHPIYTPLMILFLMGIGFYDIIINKKPIPIKWMFDNIDQYHSSIIPTHFLYSTGDKLISSSIIESFIENQKSKKGWIISSKRWDNAAHVDILRSYPEEYKQSIQLFINQCENTLINK